MNKEVDNLLIANDFLKRRIDEIQRQRCKDPAVRNTTPTLQDIERTHTVFLSSHYKPHCAVGIEYDTTGPSEGQAAFGQEITFSIPQFGEWIHDMCVRVQLDDLRAGPVSSQCRYVEFPGHRLFKSVRFEVQSNDLDSYGSDTYNFHYNFRVPDHKRAAWRRCVGQENPVEATLVQNPGVDEYRERKYILRGPQTPKSQHEKLEMYIPLLFWFNLDPRISLPSAVIPYGQRFIKIQLAEANEICTGLPTTDFIAPRFSACQLYINNIFVNSEIQDILVKRIGMTMIRVHREERLPVNSSQSRVETTRLKYPTETLYVGIQPNINLQHPDLWWRYNFNTTQNISYPVAIPNPVPGPANVLAFNTAQAQFAEPTIRTLSVESLGIKFYDAYANNFYDSYLPQNAGRATTSPEPGVLMIPFNLYPGAYQPSGYFNVSATRELILNYTSDVISPAVPGELVVLGIALNFLVVANNSATLRFNT